MLDINFIRDNQEKVKNAIKVKAIDLDLDRLLGLDEQRREIITKADELKKQRNEAARKRDVKEGALIKAKIAEQENELKGVLDEYDKLMALVPNIPSSDTPVGGAEDYKVIDTWGEVPKFDFKFKDHIELGRDLDILDLERGVKVAGFRGYFLKNEGALLHLGALLLAFKKMVEKGLMPMIPPTVVRDFALFGSGHFPEAREEIYELEEYSPKKEKETKFLVGTAEPSLLAYYADETLNEKDLPIKMVGFSPCYRREVGGYGQDTKGIYRIHEFMKVEQVVLARADLNESEKLFQEMNENARELLRELELPHRVVQIASRDMGAGKYKMYDIECWMPSRKAYGETHSNSNLTDWQARRLNIKYRSRQGKTQFVYTLNNTVIASPRILIAILENNQQKDGSVMVPKVLQDFVGTDLLKPKK